MPNSVTKPDYAEYYKIFSVQSIKDQFVGDFKTGINVCVECCDAHVETGGTALMLGDE